jgi:uncharacterized protein
MLFTRAPVLGRVKTRLAGEIGEAAALEVHMACVADTLDNLDQAGLTLRVYCHPGELAGPVRDWLGPGRTVMPQRGDDLGQRLRLAFEECFRAGAPAVLAVGGDTPHLPAPALVRAAEALTGQEAVLGPALDGGYYLIGFTAPGFCPEVFKGVAWGGPEVYARTLDILRRRDVSTAVLPVLRDLDTAEDARALARDLAGPARPGLARASRTAALLAVLAGRK